MTPTSQPWRDTCLRPPSVPTHGRLSTTALVTTTACPTLTLHLACHSLRSSRAHREEATARCCLHRPICRAPRSPNHERARAVGFQLLVEHAATRASRCFKPRRDTSDTQRRRIHGEACLGADASTEHVRQCAPRPLPPYRVFAERIINLPSSAKLAELLQ